MKNLNSILIILLFITSLSFSAEAQFIKKIQKAANRGIENAIEKKVEKEATKMTEKQLEKLFYDMYGNGSDSISTGGIDMSKVLAGLGEPVDTEDQYDFVGYAIMEMTSEDQKGKTQDPVHFKSYLGKSVDYSGMEVIDPKNPQVKTTMIFDVKNTASIILMDNDGEKMSLAYKLDMDDIQEMADAQMESSPNEDEITPEKTGKTKDILGYSCEEYHIKSEDGEGYYWVTQEPISGYSSFWGANNPMMASNAKSKYAERFKNLPTGNFLELTFTSSDGKVEMKAIDIKESDPKSFELADYPNMMQAMNQE
ncbi:DUF4412 domain-containing protein [Algoriphagus sp. D3-2-R+10]|uniref:DUF4412 domain-containing protein n=1 Tax=Algoriphagus aurantiacus TaxID=3103948 RepID=UPI002B3D2098|nr:DUF4412 domain-containing protein [Algoriphagus sp. D3-2-R+10]MEB2775497.1 DUF4412 domain-containing protein [Algoriphagus sp. D3-2-R+10]